MKTQVLPLVSMVLLAANVSRAADWPAWRGPGQNGMAHEAASVTSWSPDGDNLRWKIPLDGRTTPVLFGNRLFAIAPTGTGISLRERAMCLDADTGKLLWEYPFNPFDTDIVENRLGWTSPAVDPETGYSFFHTTGGEFFCFDRDGKVVWKTSLTENFGRISGYGGRLHTPVVDEDRVVINFNSSGWSDHAKPAHRYVAFDKKTGEVIWNSAPGGQMLDTTYSAPVVAVVNGIRMLIAGNADGWVHGMKARTGEKVWSFQVSKLALNASVVVDGNYVYATHSEENVDTTEMGRAVCIDATKTGDITKSGEVWRVNGCEAGYASPAVANGRLYVVDNSANLFCFDAKSGNEHWRYKLGRVGKGSPVVTTDGVIYVGEQNGVFHILKDEGDKCVSLDRDEFTRTDGFVDEIFGSPIVAGGRVYFMTRYHMYCLEKKGAAPPPTTAFEWPKETTASSDASGALVITPSEVTLSPGESVKFKARLYNPETTRTTEPKIDWSVAGAKGEMKEDGTFTAAADPRGSVGQITATGPGTKATVRVRVVAPLPYHEDFDSFNVDSIPPGWVGAFNKLKVVERDGGKVLQKLAVNPNPAFMRVRAYASEPIEGGYTMQVDMLGTPKGEVFKPDMGVINTRYWLTLMGGDQTLRLETWGSMPRFRHEVPFAWKTDSWYRMKFQVKLDGGKAKLFGKVWPRDDKEPEKWTIEFEDPIPHTEGSPALYGYSPGTTAKSKGPEVFFDNLEVTK